MERGARGEKEEVELEVVKEAKEEAEVGVGVEELPLEILHKIFGYLDIVHLFQLLFLNKQFHQIVSPMLSSLAKRRIELFFQHISHNKSTEYEKQLMQDINREQYSLKSSNIENLSSSQFLFSLRRKLQFNFLKYQNRSEEFSHKEKEITLQEVKSFIDKSIQNSLFDVLSFHQIYLQESSFFETILKLKLPKYPFYNNNNLNNTSENNDSINNDINLTLEEDNKKRKREVDENVPNKRQKLEQNVENNNNNNNNKIEQMEVKISYLFSYGKNIHVKDRQTLSCFHITCNYPPFIDYLNDPNQEIISYKNNNNNNKGEEDSTYVPFNNTNQKTKSKFEWSDEELAPEENEKIISKDTAIPYSVMKLDDSNFVIAKPPKIFLNFNPLIWRKLIAILLQSLLPQSIINSDNNNQSSSPSGCINYEDMNDLERRIVEIINMLPTINACDLQELLFNLICFSVKEEKMIITPIDVFYDVTLKSLSQNHKQRGMRILPPFQYHRPSSSFHPSNNYVNMFFGDILSVNGENFSLLWQLFKKKFWVVNEKIENINFQLQQMFSWMEFHSLFFIDHILYYFIILLFSFVFLFLIDNKEKLIGLDGTYENGEEIKQIHTNALSLHLAYANLSLKIIPKNPLFHQEILSNIIDLRAHFNLISYTNIQGNSLSINYRGKFTINLPCKSVKEEVGEEKNYLKINFECENVSRSKIIVYMSIESFDQKIPLPKKRYDKERNCYVVIGSNKSEVVKIDIPHVPQGHKNEICLCCSVNDKYDGNIAKLFDYVLTKFSVPFNKKLHKSAKIYYFVQFVELIIYSSSTSFNYQLPIPYIP